MEAGLHFPSENNVRKRFEGESRQETHLFQFQMALFNSKTLVHSCLLAQMPPGRESCFKVSDTNKCLLNSRLERGPRVKVDALHLSELRLRGTLSARNNKKTVRVDHITSWFRVHANHFYIAIISPFEPKFAYTSCMESASL